MEERNHNANIVKITKKEPKIFRGNFEVVDGILSFNCETKNVSFEEVEAGITKLRDECQRQIDNKKKCPFHKEK